MDLHPEYDNLDFVQRKQRDFRELRKYRRRILSDWSKVTAILDKEVDRAIRKKLGKIKGFLGNGKTQRKVTMRVRVTRRAKSVPRGTKLQRQRHGTYLGLTRSLPAAAKSKLSAIYKEKGVRAAIAEARRVRKAAEA